MTNKELRLSVSDLSLFQLHRQALLKLMDLRKLDYREREIIKLRYSEYFFHLSPNYTLEEIGHIFKVTRERIRQIEQRALNRLRCEIVSRKEMYKRIKC